MSAKIYTTVGLVIAIIIVLNLLANEYYVRIDLTEDRQYTLSPATKDILENLDEPVTVKAYFSANMPPNIMKTRRDFQDLLVEYADIADGQVVYEFVNPNESEALEQTAQQNGIAPVLINVREKDQVKQQRAYLGATIELGEKKEVIPFIQPGAAMEYALSSAIKKISVDEKPIVGFLTGHGEPSLAELPQLNEQLQVLYQTTQVSLTDSTDIPNDLHTLVIIGPTDSIPQNHLDQMDNFLSRGGRLLVAINRVQGDFRSMYGMSINTGLETWLQDKGIHVMDNFVADLQCGSLTVPQRLGFFTVQANISFPFLPVIGTFAKHPITSGLESVMLQFASEVRFSGDSTKMFTPLAYTSDLSATMQAPQFFDINRDWTEDDFPQSRVTVAAALEGQFGDNGHGRLVVIGDGDFMVNGTGQQQQRVQPDNINLMANAIDWLSDDTGLVGLRTKGAINRPIRELPESTRTAIKYTNFLLPMLLAIGYGIYRAQRNRITRLKRMGENFGG